MMSVGNCGKWDVPIYFWDNDVMDMRLVTDTAEAADFLLRNWRWPRERDYHLAMEACFGRDTSRDAGLYVQETFRRAIDAAGMEIMPNDVALKRAAALRETR